MKKNLLLLLLLLLGSKILPSLGGIPDNEKEFSWARYRRICDAYAARLEIGRRPTGQKTCRFKDPLAVRDKVQIAAQEAEALANVNACTVQENKKNSCCSIQ